MNKLFVVGLTGQTGAGKSVVAQVLAEKGCALIDADALSRRAVGAGSACLQRLVDAFSEKILLPDGSLNRAALAAAAFDLPEHTALLNSIVHPEVIRMTEEELEAAARFGKTVAVIDAPLLFQAGLGAMCDCTVAVVAPQELRLQRICARDSLTPQQALSRMAAQPEEEYYTTRAVVILQNTGDLPQLREGAARLYDQVEEWRNEQ